jgi:ADP-ribose pyrophosphatase YjhB (NUDIX family)
MRLILTIRDIDTGASFPDPAIYKERSASRAVVFDGDHKIALLHATNKHYHKLPGGGIEAGENIETALHRELSEEIGCSVQNIRELGIIEEYRNKFSLHQISYCFLADLAGEKGTPHLEEDEIADGFEPVWMDLEAAIKTLESETSIEDYEGRFIQMRDLAFLKEALKMTHA